MRRRRRFSLASDASISRTCCRVLMGLATGRRKHGGCRPRLFRGARREARRRRPGAGRPHRRGGERRRPPAMGGAYRRSVLHRSVAPLESQRGSQQGDRCRPVGLAPGEREEQLYRHDGGIDCARGLPPGSATQTRRPHWRVVRDKPRHGRGRLGQINTRHPSKDFDAEGQHVAEHVAAIVAAKGTSDGPKGYERTVGRSFPTCCPSSWGRTASPSSTPHAKQVKA